MPETEEVAERIARLGLPVLFLDTCILLDIVRSTMRCLRGYAESAVKLMDFILGDRPRCVLVLSSLIPGEWDGNVSAVVGEVDRHLRQIEDQSRHFHDACAALGIIASSHRGAYAQFGLGERLRELSGRLLSASIILHPDPVANASATRRVITNAAPSKSGGQLKDCIIIEEYLAFCRKLADAGVLAKRIFCTSNTKDYCERSNLLHPHLERQFAEAGLIFKVNLNGAVREISS